MSDQRSISAEEALQRLQEGNRRYIENNRKSYDYLEAVKETASGQRPFVTILGCIDSRVIPEWVFDQNIGDIFSVRVAGNVISEDVLASLEFGCAVAGTRLIVVKGHTGCGAVKGACDGESRGHLAHLLKKIEPAIREAKDEAAEKLSEDAFRDRVSHFNVLNSIREIKDKSPLIRSLIESGTVKVAGALYDIKSGKVNFLV